MTEWLDASGQLAMVNSQKKIEMSELEQKYANQLTTLEDRLAKAQETLRLFAEQEREELFSKAKSVDFFGAKIGFRTNPPRLVLAQDEAKIIEKMRDAMPGYLVVKETIDKKSVIRDYENDAKTFKKLGLTVEQEEVFFVK